MKGKKRAPTELKKEGKDCGPLEEWKNKRANG